MFMAILYSVFCSFSSQSKCVTNYSCSLVRGEEFLMGLCFSRTRGGERFLGKKLSKDTFVG